MALTSGQMKVETEVNGMRAASASQTLRPHSSSASGMAGVKEWELAELRELNKLLDEELHWDASPPGTAQRAVTPNHQQTQLNGSLRPIRSHYHDKDSKIRSAEERLQKRRGPQPKRAPVHHNEAKHESFGTIGVGGSLFVEEKSDSLLGSSVCSGSYEDDASVSDSDEGGTLNFDASWTKTDSFKTYSSSASTPSKFVIDFNSDKFCQTVAGKPQRQGKISSGSQDQNPGDFCETAEHSAMFTESNRPTTRRRSSCRTEYVSPLVSPTNSKSRKPSFSRKKSLSLCWDDKSARRYMKNYTETTELMHFDGSKSIEKDEAEGEAKLEENENPLRPNSTPARASKKKTRMRFLSQPRNCSEQSKTPKIGFFSLRKAWRSSKPSKISPGAAEGNTEDTTTYKGNQKRHKTRQNKTV